MSCLFILPTLSINSKELNAPFNEYISLRGPFSLALAISKPISEHGKDIDNLLYKVKLYTYNSVYGRLNESDSAYKLSLSEQEAARDLLIYCLEDYKKQLLNDCTICEGVLNGTININEAQFDLTNKAKLIWSQGKDKVESFYNETKTKIKEINDLIKSFLEKSITSLKDFANKIVEVIEKLKDNLLGIAEKIGFSKDNITKITDKLSEDLKQNPDKVTKNDIYESLGNEIRTMMINEGIVDKWNNSSVGKWIANKNKQPIWNAFFQFCNWLLVCKVLPSVVLAVFPGGLVYYIISVAVKAIWNIKKLGKIIQQTKDYVNGWNTFTKWQKIWKGIALLAIWSMFTYNIVSIGINAQPTFDAVNKAINNGEFWKQMFGAAHTGIEPDKFEAWGAAIIKWTMKGFSGSLDDAYNEIMESCKEIVGQDAFDAAQKAIEEGAKAVTNTNASTDELTQKIEDEVKNFNVKKSTDLLNKIKELCSKFTPESLNDDATYRIWVDGTATTKAEWLRKLITDAKKAGLDESVIQKTQDMLNSSLHAVNSNSGSVSFMELPGEIIKFGASKGLLGKNKWFGIVGELAKAVINEPLPPVTTAFSAALQTDVPILTFKTKGNGFKVRLGNKESKNYIYEISKDGVKFLKPDEIKEDKVKKAYDTILDFNKTEFNNVLNKIKDKVDEKELKEFAETYNEKLKKSRVIVLYGTRLNKDEQNKYDGKESLMSLYNYIIKESEDKKSKYSLSDIKQNFKDLKMYLNDIGDENNQILTNGKNSYKGNTKMLLQSIFSLDDSKKTSKFKYDKNYKPTPYELVKQRATDNNKDNDVFGHMDIEELAVCFTIWVGPDNEDTYQSFVKAFIDVIMLKNQFNNKNDLNIIIEEYKKLISHLLDIKNIAEEVKDKTWEPKVEWAPLKFDENKTDYSIVDKIEDSEDNAGVAQTRKRAETNLEDADAPVTGDDDIEKQTDDAEDKEDKDDKDTDDSSEQPVLIFFNIINLASLILYTSLIFVFNKLVNDFIL